MSAEQEIPPRVAEVLARTRLRRQVLEQQRREFAQVRAAGLKARHAEKLARQAS